MLLKIPSNMVVPPGSMTWRTGLCGCKRHTPCRSGDKCRGIRCSCTNETWLEQYFHTTETFGANNDGVSVWNLGWSNTSTQRKRVGANNDGVSVWELVGLGLEAFVAKKDDVFAWEHVGLLAYVNVTLRAALERSVMDKPFHATNTFGTDSDEVFVWRLVSLFLDHFRVRHVLSVEI